MILNHCSCDAVFDHGGYGGVWVLVICRYNTHNHPHTCVPICSDTYNRVSFHVYIILNSPWPPTDSRRMLPHMWHSRFISLRWQRFRKVRVYLGFCVDIRWYSYLFYTNIWFGTYCCKMDYTKFNLRLLATGRKVGVIEMLRFVSTALNYYSIHARNNETNFGITENHHLITIPTYSIIKSLQAV